MLGICGSDTLALCLEAWKPVSLCGSRGSSLEPGATSLGGNYPHNI